MQLYCRVSYKDKDLVKSCVEALKDEILSLGPSQSLDFIERHNKVNYTVELRCLPFKNDSKDFFDKAFLKTLFEIEKALQTSYRFRECWYAYSRTAGYSDKKLRNINRYFI